MSKLDLWKQVKPFLADEIGTTRKASLANAFRKFSPETYENVKIGPLARSEGNYIGLHKQFLDEPERMSEIGLNEINNTKSWNLKTSDTTPLHELWHERQARYIPEEGLKKAEDLFDKYVGKLPEDPKEFGKVLSRRYFLQQELGQRVENPDELIAQAGARYMLKGREGFGNIPEEMKDDLISYFKKYKIVPITVGALGLGTTFVNPQKSEASPLKPAEQVSKATAKILTEPTGAYESSAKSLLEGTSFWGQKIINVLKGGDELRYLILKNNEGILSQVALSRDDLTTLTSKAGHDMFVNGKWGQALSEGKRLRMTLASKEMREDINAITPSLKTAERNRDLYQAKTYHILENPSDPYNVSNKDLPDNVTVSLFQGDKHQFMNFPRPYAEYVDRMIKRKDTPGYFKNAFEDFKIVSEPELKSWWDAPSKRLLSRPKKDTYVLMLENGKPSPEGIQTMSKKEITKFKMARDEALNEKTFNPKKPRDYSILNKDIIVYGEKIPWDKRDLAETEMEKFYKHMGV
jgi:hypothetical protein